MNWLDQLICRFRKLPTPLLVTAVLSRFVFGLGLGAIIAGSAKKANWKLIGSVIMGVGATLVAPAAVAVWKKR